MCMFSIISISEDNTLKIISFLGFLKDTETHKLILWL